MLSENIFDVLISNFIKNGYQTINSMKQENLFAAKMEDWNINVEDAWEVLWFCRTLDITKNQFESAINTVGTTVTDIRQHFSQAA